MQTIEQKTIEYLLKRVQELEKENQQLKNKIHEDFVNKQIPAISEELIEKFKNKWNRTPTFKGKPQTQQNVSLQEALEAGATNYVTLHPKEIIQKDDIVFNEDHQRYIEAYLLDGEEVGDRKVKRKITNHQPIIIFSDKEPPVTQAQALTIKEQINQKVTETLTPFLEKEDLEDLLNNFLYEIYNPKWNAYGLITYCLDIEKTKKGLKYWTKIIETLR